MSTITYDIKNRPGSSTLIERLKDNQKMLFWTSILSILVGALCVIFPVMTTWTLATMVGFLMIFTGITAFIGAFSISSTGHFFGALAISLLKTISGIIIVSQPMVGALVMTIMLSALFIVDGATEMALAFEIRPQSGWGWLAISSLVSVVAGVIIATSLAVSSLWLVGFIFGLNALSTGFAFMMIERQMKKAIKAA